MNEYLVPVMEIIYIAEDDVVRTSDYRLPTLNENDSGGTQGSDKFY